MIYYTRYAPPPSAPSDTVGKSLTRQEFQAECDINNIVARVGAGLAAPLCAPEPVYTDLDQVPGTYEECFALIKDAQDRFAALPSKVRDYFGNQPANLLAFLGDVANKDKAIELGLIPAQDQATAPVKDTDNQ